MKIVVCDFAIPDFINHFRAERTDAIVGDRGLQHDVSSFAKVINDPRYAKANARIGVENGQTEVLRDEQAKVSPREILSGG